MQQIALDVEFRFVFQALNALQHGTEDYCAHMFVNGSIAAAHRNVATVGVADTNLRLHLADTNGRALVGESSSSSRLRSRSPAYVGKLESENSKQKPVLSQILLH